MSDHKARHALPAEDEQAARPPEAGRVPISPIEAAHGTTGPAAPGAAGPAPAAAVEEHDPDPYARQFAIEELTGPGDEGD